MSSAPQQEHPTCCLLLLFLPRRKASSKRQASGPWLLPLLERCVSYVCIFLLGLRGAYAPRFLCFVRRAPFTRMRIRERNLESFLGFNDHCLPPKTKSSKRVTLSAFVQTPTPPASLNVSSSTSNSLLPLKNTVKSLPENSTRNVLHLRLGTFASTP